MKRRQLYDRFYFNESITHVGIHQKAFIHCSYYEFIFSSSIKVFLVLIMKSLSINYLLFILCLYFFIFSSNFFEVQSISDEEQKQWCFDMKKQYNIIPGKSFGTLPFNQQDGYLKARCYRFFCKPHPLAGKGVFECEPLDANSSQ